MQLELPPTLLVYGTRSRYAAELAEILGRLSHKDVQFVDNKPSGPDLPPVEPIIGLDDLPPPGLEIGVLVPLFAPGLRKRVVLEAQDHGYENFPALLDPTAICARTARLGRGTHVNAGAVIASNTALGEFVLVNRSVSIGHDNDIAEYVSFGPGCVLAGNITVGRGTVIGAGATVLPNVHIGSGAVVGGGAVVTRDAPGNVVVVGNPARIVGETAGYGEHAL